MDLFSDTETTGMWKFQEPSLGPTQPYLVQLSAFLPTGEDTVRVFDAIVKPHGYTHIEKGASDIHGISFERAQEEGIQVQDALEEFNSIASAAMEQPSPNLIFHNAAFDTKVLFITYARAKMDPSPLIKMNIICTMLSLVDVVKAPYPSGRRGYKWPKLMEAYQYYFKEDFQGAHNSKWDTEACMKVYYAAKKAGHI